MRWVVMIVLPVLLGGCATPRPRSGSGGALLTVFEFDTTETRVSGYASPAQALGLALAAEVANELKQRGRPAELAPASGPVPDGGLVVRGRITTIESVGGGKVGPLGPEAACACDGAVSTSDGAPVTTFRDEQRAVGADDDPTEGPVQKCLHTMGRSIAGMIDAGLSPAPR